MTSICSLPNDLIECIYLYLPFEEIMNKQLISKKFCIYNNNSFWYKYINVNKDFLQDISKINFYQIKELRTLYNPENIPLFVKQANIAGLIYLLNNDIDKVDYRNIYYNLPITHSNFKLFLNIISVNNLKILYKNLSPKKYNIVKLLTLDENIFIKFITILNTIKYSSDELCKEVCKFNLETIKLVDLNLNNIVKYINYSLDQKIFHNFDQFFILFKNIFKKTLLNHISIQKSHTLAQYKIFKKYLDLEDIFSYSLGYEDTLDIPSLCIDDGYLPSSLDFENIPFDFFYIPNTLVLKLFQYNIFGKNEIQKLFNILLKTKSKGNQFPNELLYLLTSNQKLAYYINNYENWNSIDDLLKIPFEDVTDVDSEHFALFVHHCAEIIHNEGKYTQNKSEINYFIYKLNCIYHLIDKYKFYFTLCQQYINISPKKIKYLEPFLIGKNRFLDIDNIYNFIEPFVYDLNSDNQSENFSMISNNYQPIHNFFNKYY